MLVLHVERYHVLFFFAGRQQHTLPTDVAGTSKFNSTQFNANGDMAVIHLPPLNHHRSDLDLFRRPNRISVRNVPVHADIIHSAESSVCR